MDRRSLLALVAAAGATALVPRSSRAAAARGRGWKTILDGKSLKGWTAVGPSNKWEVVDGAVQSVGGNSSLMSDATYGDFEVRAEVWVSEDANSGIFIRCTNPMSITPDNSYECNLYDQRPDPTYGTGAIVGIAKVSPMPKAGGKWNVFTVKAEGEHMTITLNGQVTADAKDGRHAHGRIGLQGGVGTVKWRKVQIREL